MKKVKIGLLIALLISQFSNQYSYAETSTESNLVTEQAIEEKYIELLEEENVAVKEIIFDEQVTTEVEIENVDGDVATLELSIEPGAESFPITVTEFDGEVTDYEVHFSAEENYGLLENEEMSEEEYDLLYMDEDGEVVFESDSEEAQASFLPLAVPIGLALTPAVMNALAQAGGIIIVSGVAHVIETKAKKTETTHISKQH